MSQRVAGVPPVVATGEPEGFLIIRERRRAIRRHLRQNPSLKSRIEEALLDGFEAGVDLALRDTNLPLRTFPEHCSYLFDDAIRDNFLCDTRQDWER